MNNLTIEIIDGKGQKVFEDQIENEFVLLEWNSLSSGLYYYQIKTDGGKLSDGKLVIL